MVSMKKVFLACFAICMALSFTSCSSSDDDEPSGQYLYVAVLSSISSDVMKAYDVTATISVPGKKETIQKITSTEDFKFMTTSGVAGTMRMTVTCTPKTSEIIDSKEYNLMMSAGVGAGLATYGDPEELDVAIVLCDIISGSQVKKNGVVEKTAVISIK